MWHKKKERRKRGREILWKSPKRGKKKGAYCRFPPGEPCEAKWTLVFHPTVNPQGFRCFNLPDIGWKKKKEEARNEKKKTPKPLIDFINFMAFSQREGLSACVFLCLPWASPREGSPFKRRIKAFLSKGGRNTIVMTRCHPSMHLPTAALSSRSRHWGGKPAAHAACCQSGCHRFSLPDISEGGCPLWPILSAMGCFFFARWLHWLKLWLRICSPARTKERRRRLKGCFKSNGQVSDWRFSK